MSFHTPPQVLFKYGHPISQVPSEVELWKAMYPSRKILFVGNHVLMAYDVPLLMMNIYTHWGEGTTELR